MSSKIATATPKFSRKRQKKNRIGDVITLSLTQKDSTCFQNRKISEVISGESMEESIEMVEVYENKCLLLFFLHF